MEPASRAPVRTETSNDEFFRLSRGAVVFSAPSLIAILLLPAMTYAPLPRASGSSKYREAGPCEGWT
eukprot:scaffold604338_cov19-Prasinocladus_malaysianus.AAC.1